MQGLPANQEHFGPLLDLTHRTGAEGVAELEEIEALFAARGAEIAAVVTEPVQGAGGVRPAGARVPRTPAGALRPRTARC